MFRSRGFVVLSIRIGEASNPGPRQRPFQRDQRRLHEVSTLEHSTVVLRRKIWDSFLLWFQNAFPGASVEEWISASPGLLVLALVGYGYDAYAAGTPLYYYRQLLAHTQREFPFLRMHMFQAWETVSKWELLEPVQHRPPLPEPILHALASLGLAWGWFRWTAILLASFYSISRVGELLRALRSDVLTPADLLDEQEKIYIRITEPKSRKREARTQHVTIDNDLCIRFVAWVWSKLQRQDPLYSGSAGAFRSRWNATLRHLGVSAVHPPAYAGFSARWWGSCRPSAGDAHLRLDVAHASSTCSDSYPLPSRNHCNFNFTSALRRCQGQDPGAPCCAATLSSRVGPVAR